MSNLSQGTLSHQATVALIAAIEAQFSLEELASLTFRLDIEFENLPGRTRSEKAAQLVGWCRRRKRLPELLVALREERPRFDWPRATSTAQSSLFRVPFRANPHFAGREALLQQMDAQFAAVSNSVVIQVLVGLGGVGKTQLALAYCYAHQESYDIIYWLAADDELSLAAAFVELGRALGVPVDVFQEQDAQIEATRHFLSGMASRWLLVFDNASRVAAGAVLAYVPPGSKGHAIVTSRNANWGGPAHTIPLKAFSPEEAAAFLEKRLRRPESNATLLAEATGYLPLALEHAAAYILETGDTVSSYVDLLETQGARLWARATRPDQYDATITTTWEIAFQRLHAEAGGAVALLDLCSFLAPEEIPLWLLTDHAEELPAPLSTIVADPIALNDTIAALRRYSLVEREGDKLSMQQMVAAVTRARMPAAQSEQWLTVAVALAASLMPPPRQLHLWTRAERALPAMIVAAGRAAKRGIALDRAADVFSDLNIYLSFRGDFVAALPYCQQALAIREKALGPEHPDTARSVNDLGYVLKGMGDLAGARPHYERALAIKEKALGAEHPGTALSLNNLGALLQELGDLEGARRHHERALAINEEVLGPEHPDTARSVNNLGAVLRELGDLEGARSHYERALAIREKVLGMEHPATATSVNNMGVHLHHMGDLEGARRQYERALAINEKALGAEHPGTALSANNLGSVLQEMGDLQGARRQYERALAIREKGLGPEHPLTRMVRENLASLGDGND